MKKALKITDKQIKFFNKYGYLIMKKCVSHSAIDEIQNKVSIHLSQRITPFELEQEVQYPGSPLTQKELGGDTIRRLKMAYSRDEVFKNWSQNPDVISILKSLFQSDKLYLVQSHHNCIMTKQPQFSSETHWHKDIRYWNFENNYLINTWLPLDDETINNGCLQVIPKTHLWKTPVDRLDEKLFLRKDIQSNQAWIQKKLNVELKKGDLLFFHAAVFHAAGRNNTLISKNAVVFTYHSDSNSPINHTNSKKYSEIEL